jgi:hypothetical protein
MCCGPDLFTYPTFGGRVQRTDWEYGRVGSIYSDPTSGSELSDAEYLDPTPGPDVEQLNLPTPADERSPQPAPPKPVDARRRSTQGDWR